MYDINESASPPASIEVVIIVLHIFSLIGAICVFYTQAKLQRWFIARYSVTMILYHLSQLIHLTLYGVMMIDAPAAACFTRRTIALYAPRAMQIFAAGFACRIWRAVIRQETGIFNATDSWKRIDRWTSWLAYCVPIIPAALGSIPQLVIWESVRKTSVYDCRYAYSVRWQLAGADAAWAVPPTVICLGMLLASVVQFLRRWGGMLRYLDARLLPINVIVRLLVVCTNIGVAGVFHVYLSFHEYAGVSGGPWAPAGPDPSNWPEDVRQHELVRQMIGDLLSSMLGILDFFAFATDSDSLRILSGQCCGKSSDVLYEPPKPIIIHANIIGRPINYTSNDTSSSSNGNGNFINYTANEHNEHNDCYQQQQQKQQQQQQHRYGTGNTTEKPPYSVYLESSQYYGESNKNTNNNDDVDDEPQWIGDVTDNSIRMPMSERESLYYTPTSTSILADTITTTTNTNTNTITRPLSLSNSISNHSNHVNARNVLHSRTTSTIFSTRLNSIHNSCDNDHGTQEIISSVVVPRRQRSNLTRASLAINQQPPRVRKVSLAAVGQQQP
ncbi:hypothetical protein BDF22DRAFT_743024 [Syncephalis plumigaleata]|nr:hypothetical protein BDF22DRAFT_743024 [Syncephalis plumigaleata]